MLRSSFILPFLVSAAMFVPGTRAQATELARINGTVITLEEFNRKYQENQKFFQFHAPSKKAVLDDLVKRELGIQEARRIGLDRDPEVRDRMNTVLYHALIDHKLGKEFEKIDVSDDEAKDFYEQNPEIRTSHIFVALRPNAPKAEVDKAYQKIKGIQDEDLRGDKMSFSEAAQRFSEGMAAAAGGDLDYLSRDKLDPAYYAAALALKTPGRVSGIVRTQFGFHIIKLTAIRPWSEADKAQVKRLVFEKKRAAIFDRYINELKTKAHVVVHEDLVK